jgi:hypothetical protein
MVKFTMLVNNRTITVARMSPPFDVTIFATKLGRRNEKQLRLAFFDRFCITTFWTKR